MDAPKSDKRGALNPNWKGGEIGDGNGRVLIYAPDHPFPNYCGTHVYRYRLTMEKVLGRYLLPGEIVHHKNDIKNDDRPENLEVMTQSQHAKIDTVFGLKGRWAMNGHSCCVQCGTNKIRHEAKGFCLECYPKREEKF